MTSAFESDIKTILKKLDKLDDMERRLSGLDESVQDLSNEVIKLKDEIKRQRRSQKRFKRRLENFGQRLERFDRRLERFDRRLERFDRRLVHLEYIPPVKRGGDLHMGSEIPQIRPGHGLLERDDDLVDAPPYP